MPDLQKLQENKEAIINVIKSKGPSFPARISRDTGISPLFASAYLSELISERKLKISSMKIGSSPLYYIEGQEEKLENFTDYLNPREKQAFQLIKENQLLEDEKQEPVIRVAIRKLKDFAFPITVRVNGESKLFWRFFSFPQEQVKTKIQEFLNVKTQKQLKKETETQETKKIYPVLEKPIKSKIKQKHEFQNLIKSFLIAKDMEIISEISQKKKEFISKIRLNTHFGKQEFYTIAKDKKKITENDLTITLQKAQSEKMPAIFISSGELDKKAKNYLEIWKNLIKFEKIDQKP